jgi:hypothetical protein
MQEPDRVVSPQVTDRLCLFLLVSILFVSFKIR